MKFLRGTGVGILAALGFVIGAKSAIAAESVILKYRMFRGSISVAELKTFTETGELSSSLEFYLRKSEQKPENLKRALVTPIPADGVGMYRFLNSAPGEMVLDQMTTIIKNPSGEANRESLRAAIVSSALEDDKIRLIEVMENYPTAEVEVEGDRVMELHKNLTQITKRIPFFEGN